MLSFNYPQTQEVYAMQENEELSYAVKLLGDPDHPKHIQCVECREIKPTEHFKYKCTLGQAIALGRQQPFDFTSKLCKVCRKKKEKPLNKLTLKQIQNKIASGHIKGGAIGEMVKANRVADGIRRKREATYKRWKNQRLEIWHELFESTIHEHARARKNKSLNAPDTPLHAFFSAYCTAIVEVRRFFKLEATKGTRSMNQGGKWWHYIGTQTRADLEKLWEAIPFEDRHTLKQPEVFNSKLKGEPQ